MLYIMLVFSIIGGIDKLFGNKYGLGIKFDEGFKAMGGLALTIIGIYCISPVLSRIILPFLNPLSRLLNTDPSVFISSILATDLGAYSASIEMAKDPLVGTFNGVILASMLGASISFTIPVAFNLISLEDYPYFVKGILAGIVTIPIGMLVSGLLMKVPLYDIIFSLIPVIILSLPLSWGMLKAQNIMIKVFNILGKIILIISTTGLLLSILDFSLGIKLIDGMIGFEEGAIIVVKICIVLSGAYPLLYFVSRKLHRPLRKVRDKYDLDEYSVLGLVSSMTSSVPMFGIYNEMNWKGKILNAAFAVSGAYTFGGQLGYISSVSPESVNPFIVGKITSGIAALCVAVLLIKIEKSKEELTNAY